MSRRHKGLGDYTIPPGNKFAADGDPKTLGEIYAYGFRNAHRLSWDLTDGTMFASDIGMNNIEEINIVRNGGNYGWMKREGYLRERHDQARRRARPAVSAARRRARAGAAKDEFTYPVAMYDHDEGSAVTRRVRLPRHDRRAARQVRLRRRQSRTRVRRRPRRR